MSSSFGPKNRNILEMCDRCIIVSNYTAVSQKKLTYLENNMNLIGGRLFNKESFAKKFILVLNEDVYNTKALDNDRFSFLGAAPQLRIPFDKYVAQNSRAEIGYKFGQAISGIVSMPGF